MRILCLLLFLFPIGLSAQNLPTVVIEPFSINGAPALQAYAYGKHEGKWILIGGRTDGLHRRQPFAAFDAAGNNTNIYVVDAAANQTWSASISSLPVALQEQLQSTNMQYHQTDTLLYLVGGYGYSNTVQDHITYPNLTAVNLKGLSQAIINGTSIAPHFRQITNQFLAVTGGHLGKLNNTYYLAVGNRFDGAYNPIGNPTYVQTYTNAIRKFEIVDDGVSLSISNTDSMTDALQLHRRDYNMVPQVFPNSDLGYTIFSGVFQVGANLPYLNSVDFGANSFSPNNNFNQYLNHYHCPIVGVHDSAENRMSSFFFGGISQYYVDGGGLQVQDDNVPFVKTIARVSREANGSMTETKLDAEMPALLGAGAELILNDDLPLYKNEVVKMNELHSDTTLLGYIYGGINSTAANIFFSNTGTQSSASNGLFKVYLVQQALPSGIVVPAIERFSFRVVPNPAGKKTWLQLRGELADDAQLFLQNVQGQILQRIPLQELKHEGSRYELITDLPAGTYLLTLRSAQQLKTEKLFIR